MAAIEINYQDTINKANQIAELSESIKKKCTDDIAGVKENCSTVWTGDGSDAYCKKLEQIKGKIEKRAGQLKDAADSMKNAAEKMQQAEEFAKSLFS